MEKINYVIAAGIIFLLFGCGENNQDMKKNTNTNSTDTNVKNKISKTSEKDLIKNNISGEFTLNDFFTNNPELDKKVDEIFNSLTEEEKIGQMIVQAAGKYGKSETEILELIKKKRIGGVLLLKGSKSEFKSYITAFKNESKKSNSLPLIFSADAEPSLINLKISGLSKIDPTNTIKNVREVIWQ